MSTPAPSESPKESKDFIRTRVAEDVEARKNDGRVATRFPPEPNGYLHIGHAKAMGINFGIAEEYAGTCNLRFDDTNPAKETVEYEQNIRQDIDWLGFRWQGPFYASDYYERLYQYAEQLIRDGKAYVDSLTADEMREYRGTLTEPGKNSPYRDRSVDENLDLFRRMRAGEFPDGAHVVRAKIDMAAGNLNMRDPAIYRIKRETHYRTGDDWVIYPMYDYAHPLSDAIEGITHSLCSLEFEDHRPLYEWFLRNCGTESQPVQIEFARLNLTYTVMSKRKLLTLVQEGFVRGWDDPRMPTISGLRRRGYTPQAIRAFCDSVGVAKRESVVDIAQLEFYIRSELNKTAPRRMGVLKPLKVVIVNYPEGQVEEVDAVNNPEDPSMGTRSVPFSRELYIEQEDFREDPPKQFFRLAPGREVRLRYAYFIRCVGVVKDEEGRIVELQCEYDPATRGGNAPDGRSPKVTMHWVSAPHSLPAEVRLYSTLFNQERPDDAENLRDCLNPESLTVLQDARVEPTLKGLAAGNRLQLERQGYFSVDPDTTPERLVLNRTVTLKDMLAKIEKKQTKAR